MRMQDGYISTGFITDKQGVTRHFLVQWRRNWRFAFRKVHGKEGYRRLYIGPIEFEWSKFRFPSPPNNPDNEGERE